MKENAIADFYNKHERLSYHPRTTSQKRKGLKRFIAYDDRFEAVTKCLTRLILQCKHKPVRLLDMGFGDGIYESSMNQSIRKQCRITGIDISEKQLKRASKFLTRTYRVDLNSENLPVKKQSCDIIIISEILEHVFSPDHVLSEADRVLKTGGYILLTYPNSGSFQMRLALLLKGKSPLLNYPANKPHIRFFATDDILQMIDSKYTIIENHGVGSFVFDRWNFFSKIPMPRILEIVGNTFLKNLALGSLLVVQKIT